MKKSAYARRLEAALQRRIEIRLWGVSAGQDGMEDNTCTNHHDDNNICFCRVYNFCGVCRQIVAFTLFKEPRRGSR